MSTPIETLLRHNGATANPYIPPLYPDRVKVRAQNGLYGFRLFESAPPRLNAPICFRLYAVLADVSLRDQCRIPTIWGTLTTAFPEGLWESLRFDAPPEPSMPGHFFDEKGRRIYHADFVTVIGTTMYAVNAKTTNQKRYRYPNDPSVLRRRALSRST